MILLGVAGCLAAAAPSKVDVRVFVNSKESGEPLAGVVVGFPDCGIYAASETDGGAVLKGVPEGRWKFSAQMIGMLDYEVEVKVSAGMSPVFRLVTTRWASRRISCQRCHPSNERSISLPMARYSSAPGYCRASISSVSTV